MALMQNFEKLSAARKTAFQLLPYWVGALIASGVGILYAYVFGYAEQFAFYWAREIPFWSLLLIPLGMMLSFLMAYKYSPEAVGSGIPQIIAAAELAKKETSAIEKLLSFPMMLVKFAGSCLCVGLGGITGREGPTLQIASGIFYQLRKRWPNKSHLPDLQSLVLAGGAAGLAAAFNTPLGGIVFVVEEMSKVHISKIRTGVFHSVIFAGLLTRAVMGDYLYLGKISVMSGSFSETWQISLFALIVGAIAASFGKFIVTALDYRASCSLLKKCILTCACGVVVALLYLYSGEHALGSGRELIRHFLSHPNEHATFDIAIARSFGNFFTYIGGVVGGVFAPALASGAALGSWFSQFTPDFDPRIWILAGMVAFLTGLTRTPFTSFILVLEMTDSHSTIMTLMVASICAYGAAKLVDEESFYEKSCKRLLLRLEGLKSPS